MVTLNLAKIASKFEVVTISRWRVLDKIRQGKNGRHGHIEMIQMMREGELEELPGISPLCQHAIGIAQTPEAPSDPPPAHSDRAPCENCGV